VIGGAAQWRSQNIGDELSAESRENPAPQLDFLGIKALS
jgi:hypothetical protein